MKPRGVWVGRGLALLGLAAVVAAVRQTHGWALLAAAGGMLAAAGLALGPLVRLWLSGQSVSLPSDFEHALDLLRRAHGARAGWVVGLDPGDVEVIGGWGAGGAAPATRASSPCRERRTPDSPVSRCRATLRRYAPCSPEFPWPPRERRTFSEACFRTAGEESARGWPTPWRMGTFPSARWC